MLYLLSVACLLVVGYETHYSGVVSKLHHSVGGVNGGAVMGEEDEEGCTEHTALRHTCVQDDS